MSGGGLSELLGCFDMRGIYTGDLEPQPYIALHDGHIITYIYISVERTVS